METFVEMAYPWVIESHLELKPWEASNGEKMGPYPRGVLKTLIPYCFIHQQGMCTSLNGWEPLNLCIHV